ncbi:hypothetical protein [Cucumibacter marinus]|uniref:hypothetical protein n=1 Tax=Cucumibacter marinus TaxID=1121252 RepID=UPI0004235B5F|nr:hypothetical protein [Cucumibacter marinus]
MAQIIAVLTGDVVGSRDLGADGLDRLFAALEAAVSEMAGWPGQTDKPPFARYRGDGWQLALNNPALALRATLVARGAVKAADKRFDTRIGVGIGPASVQDINEIGQASGVPFEAAGKALDDLSGPIRFGYRSDNRYPEHDNLLDACLALADACSADWTQAQAEVMSRFLLDSGLTHKAIGESLNPPISQQTVWRHFHAARGPALELAINRVETNWKTA